MQETDRRFALTADYLRPGLLSVPVEARDSLYVVLSDTAEDYLPRVEDALEVCAAVDPVWFHPTWRTGVTRTSRT